MTFRSPIFCAIDKKDLREAYALAQLVAPHVGGLKLGLEFFVANGPDGVRRMADLGKPLFLDLKLNDIPATVAGAVSAMHAMPGVEYTTLHTSGGEAMMKAAVEAAEGRIKLLGVTVLTSLSDDDLRATGHNGGTLAQVVRRARLAMKSNLHGVVCSPLEVQKVRSLASDLGYPNLIRMVPGVRTDVSDVQDQKRVATPANAISWGATYLVVGRPITAAVDPAAAAKAINNSLAAAIGLSRPSVQASPRLT